MKRKSLILILSVIILAIICSLLYVSYGFFASKIEGNSSAKKFANLSQVLKLEYSDGSEKLNSELDGYFIPGSKLTKTFTITNKGNIPIDFSINLNNVTNEFEREDDLVYDIRSNGIILNSGIFPKSNTAILPKETIGVGESKTYTLIIDYLTSTENQIIDNGKVIDADIVIEEDVKTFSKFQILGNSIQPNNENGVASPTNPIEIKSLGVKTNNMFDIKDFKETYAPFQHSTLQPSFVYLKDEGFTDPDLSNVTALKMYGNVSDDGKAYKYMEGQFKPNTQYTVSFNGYDIPGSDNLTGMGIYLYYTDGTFENLTRTRKKNEWYTVNFTSAANKTISHLQIPTYGNSGAYTYLYNFQIEEGTTATEYVNKGYEVNLKTIGKNLIDFPNGVYQMRMTTSYYAYNQVKKEVCIKNGKTYTFSVDAEASTNTKFDFRIVDVDNNQIARSNSVSGTSGQLKVTFTASKDYDNIIFRGYTNMDEQKTVGTTMTYSNIQLEEGTTATEYEPYSEENYDIYLNEPLRKSGTCETCNDYIDLIDKKLYKNVYAGNIPLDKLISYSHQSSPERYNLTLGYHTTSSIIPNHKNLPINIQNYVTKKYTMDVANSYVERYPQTEKLHWVLSETYEQLIAPTGYTISSYFTENASLYPNGWSFQYALANSKINDIETPNLLKIGQDKIHFSACDAKGVCASNIIVEYTK